MNSIKHRAEAWIAQGLACMGAGDGPGAMHALGKAMYLLPADPRPYLHRGEHFLRQCDFQSAVLNYRKALRMDPSNDGTRVRLGLLHYLQGRLLLDKKKVEEAVVAFAEACRLDPSNPKYPLLRVKTFLVGARYNEALTHLDRLVDLHKRRSGGDSGPPGPDALTAADLLEMMLMRAKLHFLMKHPLKAQADVEIAHSLDPTNPVVKQLVGRLRKKGQALYGEAMAAVLASQEAKAIAALTQAIGLDPNDVKNFQLRAAVYRTLGQWDAALSDLKHALSLFHQKRSDYATSTHQVHQQTGAQPGRDDLGGPFGLGVGAGPYDRPSLDQSSALITTPMARHPAFQPVNSGLETELKRQLALTFNDLALAYRAEGKEPSAISCLTRAIELAPGVSTFYLNRGDSFRGRPSGPDLERTLIDYHKAQELAPNDPDVMGRLSLLHNQLGLNLFNAQDFRGAHVEFTKAIAFSPGARYYYHRAKTLYRLTRFTEAFRDFEKALQLDPGMAEAQKELLLMQGRVLSVPDRDLLTGSHANRLADVYAAAPANAILPKASRRVSRNSRPSRFRQ